ncbi:MAG: hypothetical protein FWC23_01620, partial [Chitinispirillia bacterium]|nr:hypothetical protein [Chitinispirillia bacterium]MCL2267875.1 hypothetical protein [Chitinispirillia bacterium]
MKLQVKVLAVALFLSGVVFDAVSQITMQPNGFIQIRSLSGNHGDTDHYGNLLIKNTANYPGGGWLVSNTIETGKVYANNYMWVGGELGVAGSLLV